MTDEFELFSDLHKDARDTILTKSERALWVAIQASGGVERLYTGEFHTLEMLALIRFDHKLQLWVPNV